MLSVAWYKGPSVWANQRTSWRRRIVAGKEFVLSAEENHVVQRAQAIIAGAWPEPLIESERNGMRAFLQRAESRLSTYQRVAGVFLNGAGLLVLLPTLARESVTSTLAFAITNPSGLPYLLLLPWLASVFVPLYAFYFLLRDLVQFYFSPRFIEWDSMRITRYSLAGLTLPYDEGTEAKAQVIAMKVKNPSLAEFIVGGTSNETVLKAHGGSVDGGMAYPLRLEIMRALRSHRRDADLTSADKVGIALSLAGSLDLNLVGEVARMEASIARHVLLLRKLVLRYSKALILFVVTTLLSLCVSAVLDPRLDGADVRVRIAVALCLYLGWAGISYHVVTLPLRWIHALLPQGSDQLNQKEFRDPDLARFETVVKRVLLFTIVSTIVILVVVFPPMVLLHRIGLP